MTIAEKLKLYAEKYGECPGSASDEETGKLFGDIVHEHINLIVNSAKNDSIFRRCIRNYGPQPQIDMMIEEMSELTKALLKWRRAKGAELTAARDCIIDELADVRIMARQMEILFQADDEVERRIDFKVQRQSKRLEEWEAKNGRN